ncbi:MAG: DUF1194 domain-containing protein [Alphaproteobacteria bacterium]|nr:DUF1194 domain-containing protein [Alphaproteobacteria bacterium]
MAATAQAADQPVDLELVFAVDVSASIDLDELKLQRDGVAQALLDPSILAAIAGGSYGRIAVAYVEWAETARMVVDWHVVDGAASAQFVADAIRAAPERLGTVTSISSAIDRGIDLFETSGYEGSRRVIDIASDGRNLHGRPVQLARDDAIARGITINALVVATRALAPGAAEELRDYFRSLVIGGPRSFAMIAYGIEDFPRAMAAKLAAEISDRLPDDPPRRAGSPDALRQVTDAGD